MTDETADFIIAQEKEERDREERMIEEHNEVARVSENMQRYGGSFVQALGVALARADIINRHKIKHTWPEEWKTYNEWGQ